MESEQQGINLRNLRQRQSLPLEAKINMTKRRIREWYEHWGGQVCDRKKNKR